MKLSYQVSLQLSFRKHRLAILVSQVSFDRLALYKQQLGVKFLRPTRAVSAELREVKKKNNLYFYFDFTQLQNHKVFINFFRN